ncbi:hypothetical protein BC831DRAFT_474585 [Entophlyctis helioformis]|nr:hypothetical protein BC831DRAFT_474585 [Entophlyctis helioformis]
MSIPLVKLLQRLLDENLHGPTLPFPSSSGTGTGTHHRPTSAGPGASSLSPHAHLAQANARSAAHAAQAAGGPLSSTSSFGSSSTTDPWVLLGSEFSDLDSKDPRWFDLFVEFFIKSDHDVHDDLLFFVRQYVSAFKSSTGSINDLEPVFVKRRVPNTMPVLTDVVDWKQSFFLNLISQLPCTLTVAICTRGPADTPTSSLAPSSFPPALTPRESVVQQLPPTDSPDTVQMASSSLAPASATHSSPPSNSPSKADLASDALPHGQQLQEHLPITAPEPTTGDSHQAKSSLLRLSSEDPLGATASSASAQAPTAGPASAQSTLPAAQPSAGPSSTSTKKPSSKTRMIAKRRVTKRVYAAPYKSRMDVKDAFMNECSYPLVYYTVNDFESKDLHLPIRDREYLCVELSVTIPDDQTSASYASATDAVAAISLDQDNTPFPLPAGHAKVVLFQGAVPYSSLLDIYQQKGIAAQNQHRSPWSKMARQQFQASGGDSGQPGDPMRTPLRTEYIMMRGPHGKGQCQVAIVDHEAAVNASTASGTGKPGSTAGSNRSLNDGADSGPQSPSSGEASMSFSDRLRMLSSAVRTQILGGGGGSSSGGSSGGGLGNGGIGSSGLGADRLAANYLRKPDSLQCSMTYVNVPWQSITGDLLEYAAMTRPDLPPPPSSAQGSNAAAS